MIKKSVQVRLEGEDAKLLSKVMIKIQKKTGYLPSTSKDAIRTALQEYLRKKIFKVIKKDEK